MNGLDDKVAALTGAASGIARASALMQQAFKADKMNAEAVARRTQRNQCMFGETTEKRERLPG